VACGLSDFHHKGGCIVGTADKAKDKAEELKGKTKRAMGHATDNEQWKAEGRADQVKGDVKQAGEKVKDAFKD
jgi:uncharacterized protein YjbJ (UPF0337 family)